MVQQSILAEPLALWPLTVTNRIAMPPLVIWKAWQEGMVTDFHLDHCTRSAGPRLVIVEATTVESVQPPE